MVREALDEIKIISNRGVSSNKNISDLIHEVISLCNDMAATDNEGSSMSHKAKKQEEDTWEDRITALVRVSIEEKDQDQSVMSEHMGRHYNHSFYRTMLYQADKDINTDQAERVSVTIAHLIRYHDGLVVSSSVREVIKEKNSGSVGGSSN